MSKSRDNSNHLEDASAAHAASAVENTPAGDIVATTLQAAIDELDAEKQPADADIPTVAASQAEMEAGTETANRTMNPEGIAQAIAALASGGADYVMLSDVKSVGTAAGSSIAGTQVRDLNTKNRDSASICTLAANQFTLAAGTYRIQAMTPAFKADNNVPSLYNVSDTAIELFGGLEYSICSYFGNGFNHLVGEFTIASAKIFELRQYTSTATATFGLGQKHNQGDEIYSIVELWRS